MEVLSQQIVGPVEDGSGAIVNIKCGGPKLSHFFFVDDLLLFGEASQARLMEHVMLVFVVFLANR